MATRKTKRPPKRDDGDELAELRTLEPRDYVRIDGVPYPLLSLDAMSITQRARLAGLTAKLGEIERRAYDGAPRERDDADYDHLLRELVPLILPTAPADALRGVGTGSLADLAAAFFNWVATRSPRLAAASLLLSRTSSRSSRRSTAPASGS